MEERLARLGLPQRRRVSKRHLDMTAGQMHKHAKAGVQRSARIARMTCPNSVVSARKQPDRQPRSGVGAAIDAYIGPLDAYLCRTTSESRRRDQARRSTPDEASAPPSWVSRADAASRGHSAGVHVAVDCNCAPGRRSRLIPEAVQPRHHARKGGQVPPSGTPLRRHVWASFKTTQTAGMTRLG